MYCSKTILHYLRIYSSIMFPYNDPYFQCILGHKFRLCPQRVVCPTQLYVKNILPGIIWPILVHSSVGQLFEGTEKISPPPQKKPHSTFRASKRGPRNQTSTKHEYYPFSRDTRYQNILKSNFIVSPCIFYIDLICTNFCTCIYEYNIT